MVKLHSSELENICNFSSIYCPGGMKQYRNERFLVILFLFDRATIVLMIRSKVTFSRIAPSYLTTVVSDILEYRNVKYF
jgi:hypothetical protein